VARLIAFLNGIAERRHHSQGRSHPRTMFFNGFPMSPESKRPRPQDARAYCSGSFWSTDRAAAPRWFFRMSRSSRLALLRPVLPLRPLGPRLAEPEAQSGGRQIQANPYRREVGAKRKSTPIYGGFSTRALGSCGTVRPSAASMRRTSTNNSVEWRKVPHGVRRLCSAVGCG